jgi:hypothetical protein
MPFRVLVVPVSGLTAAPPSQLFRVAKAEADRGDIPEQSTVAPRPLGAGRTSWWRTHRVVASWLQGGGIGVISHGNSK